MLPFCNLFAALRQKSFAKDLNFGMVLCIINIVSIVTRQELERGVCYDKEKVFMLPQPILRNDRHSRMQNGFIDVRKLISRGSQFFVFGKENT